MNPFVAAVSPAATRIFVEDDPPKSIAPVAVSAARVPTDVSEEVTTVAFKVVPVSVPAAAVTVIAAVPSKFTPLMARAVASAAAVVAAIVPDPEIASDAPVPTTIAAAVFVDPVRAENAVLPPDPQSDPVPLTTPEELACRHCVPVATSLKVRPEAVGEVPNMASPVPVFVVSAASRFAEEAVARKVATPEPSPEIPVATGSPVALVRVAEDGVPSAPPL